MRKNFILGLMGITLFFLVLSVLYVFIRYTNDNSNILAPFIPLVVLSGFFIFLVGAFLVALAIFRFIDNR